MAALWGRQYGCPAGYRRESVAAIARENPAKERLIGKWMREHGPCREFDCGALCQKIRRALSTVLRDRDCQALLPMAKGE